jgi:hypothetical protein
MNAEQLALELFEYKVSDMLERKRPKGGIASVWELKAFLNRELEGLSDEERQRFAAASATLGRVGEVLTDSRKVVRTLDQLELFEVSSKPGLEATPAQTPALLSPAELKEQASLKRLAECVWWDGLEAVLQRLAASCRAERERLTVRILYATLRNLAHYAKLDTFAEDVGLARFRVTEAVSERSNPLLSMSDLDSIAALLREFVETALNFKGEGSPYRELQLSEAQTLSYLHRFALAVARDPHAGQLGVMPRRGASSAQLRLALRELGRESLPEPQKQQEMRLLEQRLKGTLAFERSQRQLRERDIESYRQAVDTFFGHLAPHLPARIGGEAGEPRLMGGVLFAENPALRLDRISASADSLTLRLRGPLRFKFAGLALAITGASPAWSLFVADQEQPLEQRAGLHLGRKRLLLFREDDYLHLELRDETRSLAVLVTEALAVHYVLSSEHRDTLLSILKTATGVAGGDLQEMTRQALQRLGRLVGQAPDKREAIRGFLLGSSRALRVALPETELQKLMQHILALLEVGASDLPLVLERAEAAQKGVYQLSDEPLSLRLEGQPFTIRKYAAHAGGPESVVVMAPGRPLGSFTDYLLQPLVGGTLICVKAESDLAVLYMAKAPLQV